MLNPYTIRAKARFVKFFEDLYAAVNSLHTCQFTAYAYLLESPVVRWTPKWLLQSIMQTMPGVATMLMDVGLYAKLWRSVTGLKLSQRQMLKAGARIHVLERTMNVGEGISRKDDILPRRFLTEGRACDAEKRTVPLQPMIDDYYRLRGYNLRGLPTAKIRQRLGIVSTRPREVDPRFAFFKMTSPGPSHLKRLYLSLLLWFVGRAIEAAAKVDRGVRQELDKIPNGFTFALNIAPGGPAMVVGKDKSGRVRYLDANINDRYIDLTLTIKSIEAAMSLFTFREAMVTAVARDRLIVEGDIPAACAVVRILELVEVFLLPKSLASLSVRRYPEWSFMRKHGGRVLIYLRALAGI